MSNLLEQASLVMIPSGYKEDIVYSVIPTSGAGDLTFTRASNGTRIDSNGNVEVVPWNLCDYSEDQTQWTSQNETTVTANSTTAPNGTTTADTVTPSTVNDDHYRGIILGQQVGALTAFIYVKPNGYNFFDWGIWNSSQYIVRATFDLVNLTYTFTNAGTATIESVGNGWLKCGISGTNASLTTMSLYYRSRPTGGTGAFAGNGTSGAFVWGAQLNIGSTAKPYFPTTDRLNVPRLTYQNGGGGCPSLLLEKQSTNLVTYSEQFDNAAWSKAANNATLVVTANYGVSPDGTQNADRIQMTQTAGSSNYSQIYQLVNVTSGNTYTWSVWLKSLSGTPTVGWAYDGANWSVITLTTEWQRYTITKTAQSTAINSDVLLYGALSTSLAADFLMWGFQLEASSYATSYIPTTSSSATRVADACYKNSISSLIGQSSGVVFADIVPFQFLDGSYIGISDNASAFNRQIFGFEGNSGNSGTLRLYGWYSGSYGTFYAGQRYKIAMAYANNDFVVYVNGTQVVNQTSGTITGTLSHFGFDSYVANAQNFQGQVNEAILFQTRLTNSELAQLTGNQNYTINQAYASYGVASESPNCVQP